MADDPLGAVYSFVERAYVRLQAGDVLTQCLNEGSIAPMQKLVESLVLSGPQSLSAYREVLEELTTRKTQLETDRHQVYQKLEDDLKNYGMHLSGMQTPLTLARLSPAAFLVMLRAQGIRGDAEVVACLQYLEDANSLLQTLNRHAGLLNEIELYLQDWLWGLIYQSTHAGETGDNPPEKKWML